MENGIVLGGVRSLTLNTCIKAEHQCDLCQYSSDLSESLVDELMDKINILHANSELYKGIQSQGIKDAKHKFSGLSFSQEFWDTVLKLYVEYLKKHKPNVCLNDKLALALKTCTLTKDKWSRVFESSTYPMVKVFTRQGVVLELCNAILFVKSKYFIETNKFSIVSDYYRGNKVIFASDIEELQGIFLNKEIRSFFLFKPTLIKSISGLLKPFQKLHKIAEQALMLVKKLFK